MSYKRIMYKDMDAKLEIFNKNHKSFKSLPVYQEALRLGIRVPKLYNIKEENGQIHRVTEWVSGDTIYDEMKKDSNNIRPICIDLARYITELRDVGGMSPVDNHFKNFVWNDDSVVYIDLKKLWYESYEDHIMRMSKLCLKSCRGDREKVFYFLKGYSKYKDVRPIIEDCDGRGWQWVDTKGNILRTESIKLKELL